MKISSLLITVFIISMFSAGFVGFYGHMLSGVNGLTPNATEDFGALNDTSNVSSIINEMQDIVNASQSTPVEAGDASTDAPYNLLTGAYNAVMQAITLPVFFSNMMGALMFDEFGIPQWFSEGLLAIVSILVIVGLVKFFAGRDL